MKLAVTRFPHIDISLPLSQVQHAPQSYILILKPLALQHSYPRFTKNAKHLLYYNEVPRAMFWEDGSLVYILKAMLQWWCPTNLGRA